MILDQESCSGTRATPRYRPGGASGRIVRYSVPQVARAGSASVNGAPACEYLPGRPMPTMAGSCCCPGHLGMAVVAPAAPEAVPNSAAMDGTGSAAVDLTPVEELIAELTPQNQENAVAAAR